MQSGAVSFHARVTGWTPGKDPLGRPARCELRVFQKLAQGYLLRLTVATVGDTSEHCAAPAVFSRVTGVFFPHS